MPEPFTTNSGLHHAFAPFPTLIKDTLHRIHVVFEGSDGRCWSASTDLILPTAESAATLYDNMNTRLGADRKGWTAFAARVFAEQPSGGDDNGKAPCEFPEFQSRHSSKS